MLPVILYGRKIWCVLFVGRKKLWVFGNGDSRKTSFLRER